MTHWLLCDDGSLSRAAIMRRAHSLHKANRRKSFAHWLAYAWRTAHGQRESLAYRRAA
jgi:hypothetical protein